MIAAWRVFHNEIEKLIRMKMMYLGPVCIGLVSVAFSFALNRISGGGSNNGWAKLAQTAQLNVTGVIPIFVLIYGSSLIAGETDRGTLSYALSRPVGRVSFLAGKVFASWLYAAVLLGCAALAGVCVGLFTGDFGPVEDFGEVLLTPAQAARQLVFCFALAALPLSALGSFALAISVFARTLLGAVCFSIGVWITLTLTQSYFSDVPVGPVLELGDLLLIRAIDVPLKIAQSVASGMDAPWDQPGLVACATASVAWSAVFLSAAIVGFCRQDLNRR